MSSTAMRSRRIARCPTCGLYVGLCVCASLPKLETPFDVVVLCHRNEQFKSTNTGKLASAMLERGSFVVRDGPPSGQPSTEPTAGAWVLFPSEDAVSPSEARARGITRLIVPDGNWPQAGRIARRDPRCRGLPCIRVETTRPSLYALRRSERPFALSTFEAIAEALRPLASEEVASTMLAVFAVWVARAERVRAGAHERRITE